VGFCLPTYRGPSLVTLGMPESSPRVSVLMLAYNHEPYLAEAIESAATQETTFPFEIVIGEDFSTDRTREIIQDLALKYPGLVVPLFREHNLGITANVIDTYRHCRGEYVAILEGDDYWISHQKLQTQVEFMDAHPDYSLCQTNSRVDDEVGGGGSSIRYPNGCPPLGVEDFIKANPLISCAIMSRNRIIEPLPKWFSQLPATDLPLGFLHAERGKIGFIDEVMAVYRKNSGSFWTPLPIRTKLNMIVSVLKRFDRHFRYRYHGQFLLGMARWKMWAAEKSLECGNIREGRRYLVQSYLTRPFHQEPDRETAARIRRRLFA